MEDLGQRLFKQAMDLWINPEIKKRQSANRLSTNFVLTRAQILFSKDRKLNKIRLNNEVKAVISCKVNKSIMKGEPIYDSDVDSIQNIKLTNKDPNCGHITLLFFKGNWIISFDFRYNKKRAKERIEAATEFFESAKENLNKNLLRPFYENCFACVELLTEAILIIFIDREQLKSHKSRIERIQNWANLGNVKKEFSDIFKKLESLRSSARYMSSTEFRKEKPQDYIKIIEEMINFTKKNLS